MKHSDFGSLPPCVLSTQCRRLLNDLDALGAPDVTNSFEQVFSTTTSDRRDELLLEQIRRHLPGCPTCTSTLAQERQLRSQQRDVLRRYLADSESRVPSTTERIFAALQEQEQLASLRERSERKRLDYILPEVFLPPTPPTTVELNGNSSSDYRHTTDPLTLSPSRRWLRNGLALATVAALLFAALGIFGHFILRPSTGGQVKVWTSVMLGLTMFSTASGVAKSVTNLSNYNPDTEKSDQVLAPIQAANDVQFDGVSEDGKNLLYQVSDGGYTTYSTLNPAHSPAQLYSVSDANAGNAVWMDTGHALISTNFSVEKFDIHTRAYTTLFSGLNVGNLAFYHEPYLYFFDSQYLALYRINITTGGPQQVMHTTVGDVKTGLHFLNCLPDGEVVTIYCEGYGEAFQQNHSIYAVNSDGTDFHALNRQGTLVGFAPGSEHSLLYLQSVQGQYRLLKLGKTPQQDTTILSNIAPGIHSITGNSVALAPDGHALIVSDANVAATSSSIWYVDLTTYTQHPLLSLQAGTRATFIGWNQIPVTGSSPSPTATTSPPGNASPTATVPFDGWNGVVLITGTDSKYNLITTYNYLNGDHRLLADAGANIQFDWVGSQGQNMLYQVTTGGHTLYFTLNKLPTTGFFYKLDEDNALNAIWMPDNVHVLIATVHDGVVEVNTQTGQSQPYLPTLQTQALKFYRDGYLYFLGGPDRAGDTLFRINVTTGIVKQVTFRSMGGDFWLSPDGSTVYFKVAGPAGPPGIYAVNSDGTGGTVLRPDGTPIGYAADDSLVIMREVNHQFEVVQLGATPRQDRVLVKDVAPGAASLCDPTFGADTICDTTNIALSPLGHALIVIASYPDGSRKVWSDDLTTGKQFVMLTPSSNEGVIVPGWDRIAVP